MGKIRDNVRRNLGYYLTLTGISQKELSEKLGVSQAAVSNWIKGYNSPDIEVVAEICSILGISVSDLFGSEESNSSLSLSTIEKEVISRYRAKTELQNAVNILLGITDTSGTAATLADDLAQEINALQSTRHTATKQN